MMPTMGDQTARQPALFDELPAATGPVWASARRSIGAAVLAGALDEDRDALVIAHLASLAVAMDTMAGRSDPRAMTLLSKELRAVADMLGLGRQAPPAPRSGPFDFLELTDPAE